ncbi:MAG: plastocyanin/azurin family copper-binding protein, partial [Halosimplex sp.]
PGTKVVWKWTGKGGQHNVTGEDHDFQSPLQGSEGDTYALKFDGQGVVKYACAPHKAAGMKGAVVVGDPAAAASGGGGDLFETSLWGLAGAIVAAPFVASEVVARRRRNDEDDGHSRGPPRQPAD